LDCVYKQIGDELKPFLKLYKIAKNQGTLGDLGAFVSILKNAAYNIRALQKQHELVKDDVKTVQYQKQEGQYRTPKAKQSHSGFKKAGDGRTLKFVADYNKI
jgi:uncharacterized protein YxeA